MSRKYYMVRERECGNYIESCYTYEEGLKLIEQYEEQDKKNDEYTPNFYEVVRDKEEDVKDLLEVFRNLIDKTFSEWYYGQTDNTYIENLVLNVAKSRVGYGDGVYDYLNEEVYDAFSVYSLNKEDNDFDDWLESDDAEKIYDVICEIERLKGDL